MLFSIITVTRNNLAGLKKTAHNIINSTNQNFEWIIIDGASNDGSIQFIQSLTHPNLKYISEPDNGIYDAMNKGINLAQGEYLLFMNAGDTLSTPDILENITSKIKDNMPDFIYCDALENNNYKKSRNYKHINYGMFTHHQAMIYKRKILDNIRYNQNYKIAADYDLTIKFLQKTKNIMYINQAFCVFEIGGISQRQVKLGRDEQFKIRMKNHKCTIINNIIIYVLQIMTYTMRNKFPQLYWIIKK